MPVVPAGARHATINVNGIDGGQPVDGIQTPCVADLLPRRVRSPVSARGRIRRDQSARSTRSSRASRRERRGVRFDVRDLMVVHPTRTPDDSPVIAALDRAIRRVLGRRAGLVASPGTYDHKHVARIAGVPHCVAYGPGELDLAHQPDEWCAHRRSRDATKVIALATLDLMGRARR